MLSSFTKVLKQKVPLELNPKQIVERYNKVATFIKYQVNKRRTCNEQEEFKRKQEEVASAQRDLKEHIRNMESQMAAFMAHQAKYDKMHAALMQQGLTTSTATGSSVCSINQTCYGWVVL